MPARYEVHLVGHVESPLVDRQTAPKQGFEGSPVVTADTKLRAAGRLGIEIWVLG
jgi:hypothetical protein